MKSSKLSHIGGCWTQLISFESSDCSRSSQGSYINIHYITVQLDFLTGVPEALKELQANYDSEVIGDICFRSGNTIVITCFSSTSAVQPFVENFFTMSQLFRSAIFESIWSETMENANISKPNLGIGDLYSQVWNPTFEICQQLLEKLHDKSIPLSDVDKYFHRYKKETLKAELERLAKGIDVCCEDPKDPTWIRQAVKRMERYWKVCTQCRAANSFLQLRDTLKLTKGDFGVVEKISTEVSLLQYVKVTYSLLHFVLFVMQVSCSLKNHQTLGDINEELVSAGKFLSEFSGPKVECIKTFCDCQDIVQWIKETTSGV